MFHGPVIRSHASEAHRLLHSPLPQGPLTIGGRSLSDREKMLALSALSFITIFFLTDISTVLFSALSISSCLIAAHGASRVPDDLFLDEGQESQGLLSILGMGGAVPSSTSANV